MGWAEVKVCLASARTQAGTSKVGTAGGSMSIAQTASWPLRAVVVPTQIVPC